MLDTETLKKNFKEALLSQRENTDNPEAAAEDLSNQLCDALENWVKSIGIIYTSGLANGSGPVTGTFEYTIE